MKLTTEVHDYPNPFFKWCRILLDGVEIGRCDIQNAGYRPIGCRKTCQTLDEAAQALLRATVAKARKRKAQAESDEVGALLRLRGLKVAARRNAADEAGKRPRRCFQNGNDSLPLDLASIGGLGGRLKTGNESA